MLKNVTCVYCGCAFSKQNTSTADHVIGRNFVPWGSFEANDWNLIIRCCRPCNNLKSALESEVSAITLQPDIGENHADPELAEMARRKAEKVPSSASGKLVKNSIGNEKIEGSLAPGASISFRFLSAPQLARASVLSLAGAQVAAFFYLISYNQATKSGSGLPGGVTWLHFSRRTDWGSRLFTSFTEATGTWIPRVRVNAAKGHYRTAIKRKDIGTDLWSFALEWNKSHRIIGLFGEANASAEFVGALTFDPLSEAGTGQRYRAEVPISISEDCLFD